MGAVPDQAKTAGRRRFPVIALLAWAVLVFAIPSVVEPLNLGSVLGFPLGFFLVAQGGLIFLLTIAVLSARRQDRLAPEKTGDA